MIFELIYIGLGFSVTHSMHDSVLSVLWFNTDLKQLPFVPLGASDGISTAYLPMSDDATSEEIRIPDGFPVGRSLQSSVYVRTTSLLP